MRLKYTSYICCDNKNAFGICCSLPLSQLPNVIFLFASLSLSLIYFDNCVCVCVCQKQKGLSKSNGSHKQKQIQYRSTVLRSKNQRIICIYNIHFSTKQQQQVMPKTNSVKFTFTTDINRKRHIYLIPFAFFGIGAVFDGKGVWHLKWKNEWIPAKFSIYVHCVNCKVSLASRHIHMMAAHNC